jgi:hypothetical protein
VRRRPGARICEEAQVDDDPIRRGDGEPLTIDCDECAMQGSGVCDDCVVTFICSRRPGEAVVVDVAEERALRLLSGVGLLPGLRHVRRTG